MEVKKGAYLHSWDPHHGILGRNVCHYGMHNGDKEMDYKDRNTYITSECQAAIKALNFPMNSQLVWN
jgi:hypothetical protein